MLAVTGSCERCGEETIQTANLTMNITHTTCAKCGGHILADNSMLAKILQSAHSVVKFYEVALYSETFDKLFSSDTKIKADTAKLAFDQVYDTIKSARRLSKAAKEKVKGRG